MNKTKQNSKYLSLIIKQQKAHEFFVQYGLGTRSDFPKIIVILYSSFVMACLHHSRNERNVGQEKNKMQILPASLYLLFTTCTLQVPSIFRSVREWGDKVYSHFKLENGQKIEWKMFNFGCLHVQTNVVS